MTNTIDPPDALLHLNRMRRRHTYEPVGRCIYCPEGAGCGPFTMEHIIQESLGGMLRLPVASCQDCAKITGAFEGDIAGHLFRPIRRQFNMPSKGRGRKRKEQRKLETFTVEADGRRRTVPRDEYPGMLCSFVFQPPEILLGIGPTHTLFSGRISLAVLPDFGERHAQLRARLGADKISYPSLGSAETMGRALAKIAHAYAAAEVGLDAFRPYLLGIIRGQDPYLMTHLVGSALGEPPVGDDLHDIGIVPAGALAPPELVVVKIQLFSNYKGMPVHYVVAGERI